MKMFFYAALCFAAIMAGGQNAEAQEKPNIVFIFLDNFGWGEPGFNGGGIIRGTSTPAMDALAAEGLRLTNFNVEAQCTPSRAATMTGRYGIRSGNHTVPLGGGVYGLVQWEITMAEMLADAGVDAIVKKMFGDIEALENSEDKEIESWNKRNNMNNAYTERRTREISKQAKNRKKAVKQQPLRQSPIESLPVPVERGVGLISGGIRNLTESNLIDFVLRIHPQEKGIQRLHRECIRTSGDITIEHLKRFLGRKLAYEHYHHFQIITPLVSGKQVVLDDQMTLREIRNQISDRRRGEVLMLQYRRHIL